jgi:hypothetical protein
MFTGSKQINKLVVQNMSPTSLENIAKTQRPNEHVARVDPASQTKQQQILSTTNNTKQNECQPNTAK